MGWKLRRAALAVGEEPKTCSVGCAGDTPVGKVKAPYKTSLASFNEKIIPAASLNIPVWSGLQCPNEAEERDPVI